ncbi:MAG: AsmA family protein [Beijerinckiaceae bacterium]
MTKPMTWAASAALLVLLAAGLIPLPLWSNALQRALVDQVAQTTALEASTGGRATLAALPYPRVTYEKVRIGHPDGSVSIVADGLTAELSITRLLSGQIEFAGLRLARPHVTIDAAAERLEKSAAIQRAIVAQSDSDEARSADRARLGVVRIVNGSLRLRANESLMIVVDDVNARVDWPSLGSTATLSGRATWRGEKLNIDALLAKPAEVLRGEKSPFTGKLSSRLIDISLDGALSGGSRWLLDTRVAVSSERFTQFLNQIDVQPPVPGRLARFALSGQLRALPQSAQLSDLRLSIDGNSFDGSLSLLAGEKRPKISGTLATRTYDLRTGDAGLPVMQRERQWSKDALAVGRLDLFDADLRVSAARLNLGRLTLSDAGFVVALEDGLLEITTGAAEAYGGALRGRWRFNARTATPEMSATGNFKNINLASFLRGMGHGPVASGSATGEFDLQSRGSNVHAMMQHLSGTIRSTIRSPEVVGVDLERALRRTERRPLSIPAELRSGQTSFTAAEFDARIEEGRLEIERAVAAGPGVEIVVSGDALLAERMLRLEVAARQPRPGKSGPVPTLILDVEGPWERPEISIDPESLIQRSEAAAPLWRRSQTPAPALAPVER